MMGDYYETRRKSDPEPEPSREWAAIALIWVVAALLLLAGLGQAQ